FTDPVDRRFPLPDADPCRVQAIRPRGPPRRLIKANKPETAFYHGLLGVVYSQRGNIAGAREHWIKARDLYSKIGMQPELKKVQSWLDSHPPATDASPAP
ncbi:MAG: hypothetical protein Q7R41_05330, partial [Phycisphaerales bacterium]|nr:hypothetical protein [Phycisphaerales bacterium]